jgi:hypothetical protein
MSYRFMPGIRGLMSALVRGFMQPLVSFPLALSGLLLAAPAMAQEKPSMQATIVDVAVKDGSLTARIQWGDQASLPRSARVASYDGKGALTDGVNVVPEANTESVVKLPGGLRSPWESGWSQKLTVEDDRGQVLTTQPYDVNLNCDGNGERERCELVAYPSFASSSGVVHLSDDLDQAIKTLNPRNTTREFDLVARVSEAYPELRGEALVLAQQTVRPRAAGSCTCNWQGVIQRGPSAAQSINISGSNTWLGGQNGPGATHSLAAYAYAAFFSIVHETSTSVSGFSQLQLNMACSQLLFTIDKPVLIFRPDGTFEVVHIHLPIYGPCQASCSATFNHTGRYTGQTYVNALQQPSNRAYATEAGTYAVNNGTPLINQSTGAGGGFDNTAALTVSGYSTTARIQTSGYVRAVGRWQAANAWESNGYAMGIHGTAACMFPQEVAMWDYNTTQGSANLNSLKSTLQAFFWQWYLPYP